MSSKRSIFEEVDTAPAARVRPQGGLIDSGHKSGRRAVRIWLFALFALVAAMVLAGGGARLVDPGAGLAWKPLSGAVLPANDAGWAAAFESYTQSAEPGGAATLADFKAVSEWEWARDAFGLLAALVWALGMLIFGATRRIPRGWGGKLLLPGLFGVVLGLVGLRPAASPLSASGLLVLHLGLAYLILALIFWDALKIGRSEADLLQARRLQEKKLFGMATGVLHLSFVQILLGALVAAIGAGRGFTDWPWMAGGFLPPDPFSASPLWQSFVSDPGLVQFDHRIVGYLILLFGLATAWAGRRSPQKTTRDAFLWLGLWLFVEVVLGIVTLMHGAPLILGLAHQLAAMVAIALILRARFLARYPKLESIRETYK